MYNIISSDRILSLPLIVM